MKNRIDRTESVYFQSRQMMAHRFTLGESTPTLLLTPTDKHSDSVGKLAVKDTLSYGHPIVGHTQSQPAFQRGSALKKPDDEQKVFTKDEEKDADSASNRLPHSMFCELAELYVDTGNDVMWKECARWIKFEEDVEEGGERWSKPHVATLSLHSLMELRCCFLNPSTLIMLNVDACTIDQLAECVVNELAESDSLVDSVSLERIRNLLLLRHAHLFSMKLRRMHHNKESFVVRSLAEIGHRLSSSTRELREKETREQADGVYSNGETNSNQSGPGGIYRKTSSASSMLRLGFDCHSHPRGSVPSVGNDSVLSVNERLHRDSSVFNFRRKSSGTALGATADDEIPVAIKFDTHFMKKIPPGAETANILVGEVDFLETQVAAFVRLSKAVLLGDITEVPVPTRFVFILLVPKTLDLSEANTKHHEIGRSIATLMSDEIFNDVAYKARNREDLLVGIDEFLSNVTVIPPGEWDPTIRIEPPQNVPSQLPRKEGAVLVLRRNNKTGDSEDSHSSDDPLQRSGRLFGGLVGDVKRKLSWYGSDFRDGLHVQSIASIVFLYFACLAPTVTFGGMLNVYLDGHMATMESILSASLCGIIYSLCAGQPLIILGSTGPVLIFEKIVYDFAKANEIDFMSFRLWIGIWVTVMLVLAIAFDLSYFVRYITRFTEESFSCLVALIFVVEAFVQLKNVALEYPVVSDPLQMYDQYAASPLQCACIAGIDVEAFESRAFLNDSWLRSAAQNATIQTITISTIQLKKWTTTVPRDLERLVDLISAAAAGVGDGDGNGNATTLASNASWNQLPSVAAKDCTIRKSRFQYGKDCASPDYVPDVFFFSSLLFIGTFVISYALKLLKTARFFSARVREMLSDFAVVIAILSMTTLDLIAGISTPKLDVPSKIQPTHAGRGWLISPFSSKLPFWFAIAAIIPAALANILIFMDQQISAVIINRKENKIRKGVGYHLDLLVLALVILLCSFLGFPWLVASTVPSMNHVLSLRKETRCNAPGERPKYLGCRENRLTGLAIAVITGLSVFFTGLLKHIPLPVLHGVFLFMGISCLHGIELVHRVLIIVMPSKNQPDYVYLRNVRTSRVHLFTAIQIVSIAAMWAIKSIEKTAIAFPLLVLAMCFIRKALDYLFTQRELLYLDDIIPEEHKREKEEESKRSHVVNELLSSVGHLEVPLADGKVISIKVDSVTYDNATRKFNLSEHVNETKMWKDIVNESNPNSRRNSATKTRNSLTPDYGLHGNEQHPHHLQQQQLLLQPQELLCVPPERCHNEAMSGLWTRNKKRVADMLKIRNKPTEGGRPCEEAAGSTQEISHNLINSTNTTNAQMV